MEVGGLRIWVEIDGPDEGPVVLMSQRLGAPASEWPADLVAAITGAGFRAVRYDYRDCGRSGRPDTGYTMYDLAADAVGLLDRLEVAEAHLLGHSMGGTVSAIIAIEQPGRTRSYTVISGGGADDDIPQWTDEFAEVAMSSPGRTRESWIDHLVKELAVMSVEPFDEVAARARCTEMVDLGWQPRSIARMLAGANRAKPSAQEWSRVSAPTLVVHGTEDRILVFPHGRAIADAIAGARLVVLEGMGHDLQPRFRPAIIDAVTSHLLEAEARA